MRSLRKFMGIFLTTLAMTACQKYIDNSKNKAETVIKIKGKPTPQEVAIIEDSVVKAAGNAAQERTQSDTVYLDIDTLAFEEAGALEVRLEADTLTQDPYAVGNGGVTYIMPAGTDIGYWNSLAMTGTKINEPRIWVNKTGKTELNFVPNVAANSVSPSFINRSNLDFVWFLKNQTKHAYYSKNNGSDFVATSTTPGVVPIVKNLRVMDMYSTEMRIFNASSSNTAAQITANGFKIVGTPKENASYAEGSFKNLYRFN